MIALKNIYWYKDDLRLFLQSLDIPKQLIYSQGWHDNKEYKIKIISNILDALMQQGSQGLGHIRRIIQAVLDQKTFQHLRHLEDGAKKIQEARRSVEELRRLVLEHDSEFRKSKETSKGQQNKIAEAIQRRNDELQELQRQFYELVAVDDHNKRGILFEKFLERLFTAHDLEPRGSFKIVGEQIDGAFEFEGTQFLLEAKWEKKPQGAGPLDVFSKKVDRKLENTLGLFISLEGFTREGLSAFSGSRPSIILFDGEDLAIVLQGLIDLRDLIKRKIRHASQTGNPFLKARDVS